MADEMINKANPIPKKGVQGIGDTVHIHYNEFDMNLMNDPCAAYKEPHERAYTKGQSTAGSK